MTIRHTFLKIRWRGEEQQSFPRNCGWAACGAVGKGRASSHSIPIPVSHWEAFPVASHKATRDGLKTRACKFRFPPSKHQTVVACTPPETQSPQVRNHADGTTLEGCVRSDGQENCQRRPRDSLGKVSQGLQSSHVDRRPEFDLDKNPDVSESQHLDEHLPRYAHIRPIVARSETTIVAIVRPQSTGDHVTSPTHHGGYEFAYLADCSDEVLPAPAQFVFRLAGQRHRKVQATDRDQLLSLEATYSIRARSPRGEPR